MTAKSDRPGVGGGGDSQTDLLHKCQAGEVFFFPETRDVPAHARGGEV